MLTTEQSAEWERRLGVAGAQVRVDHLLSHMLLAVAELAGDDVIFIGGTALCRTWLVTPPWSRVSEDLDLLVIGSRMEVARALELGMRRALRREYPDAAWVTAPTGGRPPAAASLSAAGVTVRLQLLPGEGPWRALATVPTEHRTVDLRYADTPGHVTMTVPTRAGFAAMKLAAWEDRAAPRDLFDLAGMASLEAIDQHTASVFHALVGRPPSAASAWALPAKTRERWHDQLANQVKVVPEPDRCLAALSQAIANLSRPMQR